MFDDFINGINKKFNQVANVKTSCGGYQSWLGLPVKVFDPFDDEFYTSPTRWYPVWFRTPGRDNRAEAISEIKSLVSNFIEKNEPRRKVIFWRQEPCIKEYKDFETGEITYSGYARLAVI